MNAIYEASGRAADEARVRRMLGDVPGGRGRVLLQDAWLAAGHGQVPQAESLFNLAVQAAPNLSRAWDGLIRTRIQAHRFKDAADAVERARGGGLAPLVTDIYECFIAIQRGDTTQARRVFERIPVESAPQDPVLSALLEDSRRVLGAQRPAPIPR